MTCRDPGTCGNPSCQPKRGPIVSDDHIDPSYRFHVGSVVQLKSGGPSMTVAKNTEDGLIVGYWAMEDLIMTRLPQDMLQAYVPEEEEDG